MKLDEQSEKLKLEYPCEWTYKVIGTQAGVLQEVIQEIMGDCPFSVSLSNKSKAQKYCSMNLVTRVESEADRTAIYESLKNHADVVMVL